MAVADYKAVGSANDVYVTDDHAYVADGVGGLVVTRPGCVVAYRNSDGSVEQCRLKRRPGRA